MSKNKKETTNKKEIVNLSSQDLTVLAHKGTKKAIEKIEDYIRSEKDRDKKFYAEIALGECELFYYQPENEIEEREFSLCRLINEHEKRVYGIKNDIESIEAGLEKFELEQEVHEDIMAEHAKKNPDWKYRYMDGFVESERNNLQALKDDLAYEDAWRKSAKKMIVTTKYKDGIPERHLSHFDFNDELFADNKDCDLNDDCVCPENICDNGYDEKIF